MLLLFAIRPLLPVLYILPHYPVLLQEQRGCKNEEDMMVVHDEEDPRWWCRRGVLVLLFVHGAAVVEEDIWVEQEEVPS